MIATDVLDAFGAAFERRAAAGLAPLPLRTGCTVVVCTYKRPRAVSRLLDSVLAQSREPDELVIVDASPDEATREVVGQHPVAGSLGGRLTYLRVGAARRGLTRQRNLALDLVATDLVAFFDDDIVLTPGCLEAMERAHREEPRRVGVGAYIEADPGRVPLLWRARRGLLVVPQLQPGRYYRSGLSVPWAFLTPDDRVHRGDYLPGGAVMWRTALARSVRFNETFAGYGSAEDLEFSLRISAHGPLVMHAGARLLHLHDSGGRPDDFQMGYMSTQNAYRIQRTVLPERRRRDALWFWYALVVDSALRALNLLRPAVASHAARFLRGRASFLGDLWLGRGAASFAAQRGRRCDT